MAYTGTSIPIPFGSQGLLTDAPMSSIPANAAIKANNISLTSSRLEKSKGSTRYNPSYPLDAGIVGLTEWFPDPVQPRRLIALTSNGKAWRDAGDGSFGAQTPIATGLGSLNSNSYMVAGGAESAGNNKKLFIFTNGTNQVKVLSGDGTSLTNIANPAADWASGNYPTFGLIFEGYLMVMGSTSTANRHSIYTSLQTDHETFNGSASANPIFSVFPGEGDGIVGAAVYKGKMFIFKKPYGVYALDTNGTPDKSQWSISKVSDAFGLASPHSFCQILDDFAAGNSEGGITSLQATAAFGDVKAGDLLSAASVEEYIRSNIDPAGIPFMHAIYYNERKKAYFTGRSLSTNPQNMMIVIDYAKQNPRITLETKDQPNCLTLKRDASGIARPIYGANDGFVYLMEQSNYNVGGKPYLAEFQTPFTDFSYVDGTLAGKNKIFDFLEVHYLTSGNWTVNVDVFIDTVYSETVMVTQAGGAVFDTARFDVDRFGAEYTQTRRVPIHGTGRSISLRFWNNQVNQYFKIEKVIVSFRAGGEQEKGFGGAYKV